jgi:hypothetical protein
MEPVFMVLGQSAAVAAVQAIEQKLSVQKVDVAKVQAQLKANPLADGSLPEILVDNSDVLKVEKKGAWTTHKYGGYGPDYFIADTVSVDPKLIKYKPEVLKKGKYELYIYYPKLKNAAALTLVHVNNGTGIKEVLIKDTEVKVVGQTSGEWVSIGTYSLDVGRKAYVEILAKGSDGAVVADALLLVPAK